MKEGKFALVRVFKKAFHSLSIVFFKAFYSLSIVFSGESGVGLAVKSGARNIKEVQAGRAYLLFEVVSTVKCSALQCAKSTILECAVQFSM